MHPDNENRPFFSAERVTNRIENSLLLLNCDVFYVKMLITL